MLSWYVICTKSKCEAKVAALLLRKNIRSYVPSCRLTNNTGAEEKNNTPVFPGFVFVHVDEPTLFQLRKLSDVINVVYWLGKPVSVGDADIKAIQTFLDSYTTIELEKIPVSSNKMVRIVNQMPDTRHNADMPLHHKTIRITIPVLGFVLKATSTVFVTSAIELEEETSMDQYVQLVS
jgi:transcriptional antiterminator NusG